eukprot:TRINITY_DN3047_c0_g1_i1.p1 TRINITY_DN3047_c0_g1~~TRINITY_DN3047_c0_g1_i1.p1  ORF type:complete len:109 (+),score=20.95 TRINITY_DN3047_c0_g1_i1:52-378(+)
MSKVKRHTIVLIQVTRNKNTRTYSDYETVSDAMGGICQLFEEKLKRDNPNVRNITYDIQDLYKYIDSLGDLACLVLSPETASYVPHNKDWIKERILKHLKSLAGQHRT